MDIPARYQAAPLRAAERTGWLAWSLDFFTDPRALQIPYLDITLQWDVSEAYTRYQAQPGEGASFFAFLVWHFVQAFRDHPSFLLRQIDGQWYRIDNPPLVIPVAVGGAERFSELILEDAACMDLATFLAYYRERLAALRQGERVRAGPETFYLAHFFGNLPHLQFTGLTLHYRREAIAGQPLFYFGQRYQLDGRTHIPLAAKLHHACTDPHVLDQLLGAVAAKMQRGQQVPD